MKWIKWLRVVAVLVLGVGLLFQYNLLNKKKVREGFGSENTNNNFEIAQSRKDFLLPDLQVSPTKRLYIEVRQGVKKLRFDTTFSNTGKGTLELIGITNEEQNKTIAKQIINKIGGSKEEMVVGEFVFHSGHNHWHVEKYAQFQLWRYNSEGVPTELVASTDKYSFCIWDEHPYDLTLENAPQTRQYPRCPKNIQGNSIGWGDTYPADLEGQELNITEVEDGKYMVRSRVNVDNSILESDYTNNYADLYIEISGNKVTVLNNL